MRFLALIFVVTLLGCSGTSTMPPGFNETCYGGDFNKNLAGAKPAYSASLALHPSSRAALRDLLFEVAEKHELKAFDDGANYGSSFFSVYLCSSKGAFAMADSRAAKDGGVRIDVFSYADSWHPEAFVTDLRTALTSKWPTSIHENSPKDTTLMNSIL